MQSRLGYLMVLDMWQDYERYFNNDAPPVYPVISNELVNREPSHEIFRSHTISNKIIAINELNSTDCLL